MTHATSYEITFGTDDPALVSEVLAPIQSGEKEGEIRPGVTVEQKKLTTDSGVVGSEILLTIALKVVEGVAVKVLVDVLVPLVKKYGAKLKINGRPVSGNEEAVAASLVAAQNA